MKNMFRQISSKTPALLTGISLCAIFALSRPTDVAAIDASTLIRGFGSSTVTATYIMEHLGGDDNDIVLDSDLTIDVDGNSGIDQIKLDVNNSAHTLTITGTETLTCNKISLCTSASELKGALIVRSGKLVTTDQNVSVNDPSTCRAKTVTITSGTVDARFGLECQTLNMTGGSLKAVKPRGDSIHGTSITIAGGTVDARNGAMYGIYAAGLLDISGEDTVVKARTDNNTNMRDYTPVHFGTFSKSSYLEIKTPDGEMLVANTERRAILKSDGGSVNEAVIKKGPGGGYFIEV